MIPRSVPLLRCFAGDLPLGIAAEEVLEFRPVEQNLPHIATLLGTTRAPDDGGQRTLSLADGAETVLVNVDGPVKIRAIGAAEILALPPFFASGFIAPVLGFAEEDGRVVLLLDVPGVSRIARGAAPPPPSPRHPEETPC
jgi:hypothetical protein